MAEMRPPLSPTSNNVKRASEKGASQTSKKQRLGDTPQPSGAADQKPPPADGNDVDTTTRDEAPPMEVEETTPVAEEVPEEATEEDEPLAGAWLSPKGVADDAAGRPRALDVARLSEFRRAGVELGVRAGGVLCPLAQ